MRRVFTLLSTVSLVLCLGLGATWIRSHFISNEMIDWVRQTDVDRYTHVVTVSSGHGCVNLASHWTRYPGLPAETWHLFKQSDVWQPGLHYARRRTWSPGHPSFYERFHKSWYRAGFGWARRADYNYRPESSHPDHGYQTSGYWCSGVPYWSLVLLTAAMPVWRTARTIQRKRRDARRGKCARCGYDLRATPHQCPECGTEVVTEEGV